MTKGSCFMKKVDYSIHIIYIVVLIVLSVFWGSNYDPLITVLGLLIAVISTITMVYQYKKMKELEKNTEEEENA